MSVQVEETIVSGIFNRYFNIIRNYFPQVICVECKYLPPPSSKFPFSPFCENNISYCFWHHIMLKKSFQDLEYSKQITRVDGRAYSKFEAVERKNQGVLVCLVSPT